MARYQAVLIDRPEGWQPNSFDDVPYHPGPPGEVLDEGEAFFDVLHTAIEHNRRAIDEGNKSWAIVVDPEGEGQLLAHGRVCTPLRYQIASIWWPSGWEPQSPLDVPNCVCREQNAIQDKPLNYEQAVATMEGLNRQAIDRAGAYWYVIVAAENEPISRKVTFEPPCLQTTVEVRRLHIAEPASGGGRGNCEHCPARSVDCPAVPEAG